MTVSVAIDALHRAAYRRGLGNSLYVNPNKMAHLKPKLLQHYVEELYVPSNMAVVGMGMDHDTLLHIANIKLGLNKLPSGKPAQAAKAVFHSGMIIPPKHMK